jgi:GcrA cell cycle regulator
MSQSFIWDAEAIERLTRLWVEDGLSMKDIGERLGLSRQAISGKLRRLDLVGRQGVGFDSRGQPRAKVTLPSGRLQSSALMPEAGQCHWPLGDPGTPGFRFCCAAAAAGATYCPDHDLLAHPNRKRAA